MTLPGETIGVLGGGQLGRMFAQAAARMGYRVHVFDPAPGCPAGEVAALETNAPFTDVEALRDFAAKCAVVTYEFENIPSEPLDKLRSVVSLRPDPEILRISQNRLREKTWLRENGIPHASFVQGHGAAGIADAAVGLGFPSVIKTADFGYDGKGQHKLRDRNEAASIAQGFANKGWVIEAWVDFVCEVSVVVARGAGGEVQTFPVSENIHTNHILDISIVPARVDRSVIESARSIAVSIAERMNLIGLIAVEMFVTKTGDVLVNEIAPRTHNSGHYTLDACNVSQFEQQVRAVCGLPLATPRLRSPAVMVNILGDAWADGTPDWASVLRTAGTSLHLYGKRQARVGRKMGHFTVVLETREESIKTALELRARIVGD